MYKGPMNGSIDKRHMKSIGPQATENLHWRLLLLTTNTRTTLIDVNIRSLDVCMRVSTCTSVYR